MMLLIGRILTGLGVGIVSPAAILELSEISLIRYRGALGIMNALFAWVDCPFHINCIKRRQIHFSNTSFMFSLVLGAFFSLEYYIILSMVPTILFLAFAFFLPESPLWLIKVCIENIYLSCNLFLKNTFV